MQVCFKIVRMTVIRNRTKREISTNDELGLLQMILELDTKRCANENVGPLRGWIVRSHLDGRVKRSIRCEGVKTFPKQA